MNAASIKKAINKFDRFLISAHINPEGDSIGSQIALSSLLKRLHKKAVIVNESPVPHNLLFLKGAKDILKSAPKDFEFGAAIILDCPDMLRLGNVAGCISEGKTIINIDHHISNKNFGKYNLVDTNASSTGEMVVELFNIFNIKIKGPEAEALYIAIMTDTGSFRYTNTTSRTHKIIADLIDIGVKPYEIFARIYESGSIEDTRLLAESLRTLKVSEDGKVAWLWVTKEMLKETKGSLEGTENIINFARSIENVEIAILFRETGTEDRIKVSFRSKGDTDVNKLASFFDGGGHKTASGCTVFGKAEEVEKRVLQKAREMIGEKA